jgi:arylsulfatase
MMKSTPLAFAFAWLGLSIAAARDIQDDARPASRPDIVLILADDMGFSDLGCHGGEIPTPNLDALAAGGLRFSQFYNTARCCPTRASLLTGQYPHRAGMGHMTADFGPKYPGYRGDIGPETVTIAEALAPAGYHSYAVGKWHVTKHIRPDGPKFNWPRQRGFERFYGIVSGGGSYFDPFTLCRDNNLISPFHDAEHQPDGPYYFTTALGATAERYVREHHANHPADPMFLYLAFTAAHWPLHAPEEDIARFKGKYDQGYETIRKARFERAAKLGLIDPSQGLSPADETWSKVDDPAREARCMEVYAAQVAVMDREVGRLVAELKRAGRFDNTLILFLQDNGGCAEDTGRGPIEGRVSGPRADCPTLPPIRPEALPDGLVPPSTRDGHPVRQGPGVMPGPADTYVAYGRGWANVSNTPFREYKHWAHEGGISTPLIAHWPRGIADKGAVRAEPGHLIDIMPTCLDLAHATYPATIRGEATPPLPGLSLRPAFAGRPLDRDALYWEHEGNRAAREGRWKIVAKGPRSPWRLHDIDRDRVEARDLAADHPEIVARLSAKWDAWAKANRVLPWIWDQPRPKPVPAAPATAPARARADTRQADRPFARAAENARVASEGFARAHRYLEAWMFHADPKSGLIPRNLARDRDLWNGRDAAADNYPYLVLTAAMTDRDRFHGPLRAMLDSEIRLTSRVDRLGDHFLFSTQSFAHPTIDLERLVFDNTEYVKDGLLPVTEWLGPSPWSDRAIALIDDVWKNARVNTPSGPVPTLNFEVNGDLLQTCSRLYWFTGDEKYLQWAIRLGDYYLLGDHHPTRDSSELRLSDHGCEVVNGLSELYVAVAHARPDRKRAYEAPLHALYDRILEVGRNEDGLLYHVIDPRAGTHDDKLCDTWGYNLDAFYTAYLIDGTARYRDATRQALAALGPKYHGRPWADTSADGIADSVEGALNLYNREPVPEPAEWIDHQTRLLWDAQRPDGTFEGWHGDGNDARTTLMVCLWKTQGLRVEPWRADVRLGAVATDQGLAVSLEADEPWSGRVVADRPRHRDFMKLPFDYPRINQFPEWFAPVSTSKWRVRDAGEAPGADVNDDARGVVVTGEALHAGIAVELEPNRPVRWSITRVD